MNTPTSRPLGLILNAVEAMGLEVTYAFDDLVFVAHNAFLLRMEETPDQVSLFFNDESEPESRAAIAASLKKHALDEGLTVTGRGRFALRPNEDDTFEIEFLA